MSENFHGYDSRLKASAKISKIYVTVAVSLILVAIAIYFSVHPEDSNLFPQCIFHSLTGYECPGCGSQRVVHSLLHLEFKQAFFYNPLLVISIPYILLGLYMEYLGGRYKHPKLRNLLFGRNAIIIVFIIVVSFWIGRNIF